MEMRTLRYFTVVAEELNITRAAEKLGMSQPPLSSQIHNLEEELGVQLFIRGKRHLQLTQAGSLFYRRAQQILEITEMSCAEIKELNGKLNGVLKIGCVPGRSPFLLSRWISAFSTTYPQVQYNIWNGSSDDVIERLLREELDVAIIGAPFDNEKLDGFRVGREPWVAIIPVGHHLAGEYDRFIPLAALKNEPLIVPSRKSRKEAIREWFGEIGIEPNFRCEHSSYDNAVAMAEQGVGISIFPQTSYTPNPMISSKIIVEPERQVEYVMVRAKSRRSTQVAQVFLNYVREYVKNRPAGNTLYTVPEAEYIPAETVPYL